STAAERARDERCESAARPRDPDARGGGALPAPQASDHLQVGAGEAHPRGQARQGVALSPEHPGPVARRADAERRFRLPPLAPGPRAGLSARSWASLSPARSDRRGRPVPRRAPGLSRGPIPEFSPLMLEHGSASVVEEGRAFADGLEASVSP